MLRNEDLIVFTEGVRLAEEVLVERHTCLCYIEHLLVVHITDEGLSSVYAHQGKTFCLTLVVAERSSNNRVEVSRDLEGLTEEHLFFVCRLCVS